MPELPEVETVCRGLRNKVLGRTITSVNQRRPNLRYPFPEGFTDLLTGQTIQKVDRRAKYILIPFPAGTWVTHLGMSGQIRLYDTKPDELGKHEHLFISFDDGSAMGYTDPRRFGYMQWFKPDQPMLANVGVEPLSSELTPQYLLREFSASRRPIKTALLDQYPIAGLGNIYVCEALWLAKIHPQQPAGEIDLEKLAALCDAIRQVLLRAIDAGGSTLRDHAQVDGKTGYFQHQFHVYNQTGNSCQRQECVGEIVQIKQAGRSTFYCPVCQGGR